MKSKKLTSNIDVDIVGILGKLWNSKFLILFITILFTFFGFLSFKILIKDEQFYSASVSVKYPDKEIFLNKRIFLDYNRYIEIFKQYAKSDILLVEFMNQNKKIDNLKKWLKIKNEYEEYIKINLSGTFLNNKGLNLILLFPADTEGAIFLRDYIFYIKDKSLRKFLELNEYILDNQTEIYQHNLIIAEGIELNNPLILQEKKNNDRNTQIINEPKALFYLGSKVLKYELKRFKNYKKSKIIELIEYVPIADDIVVKKIFKKKKLFLYTLIGFIIGLCLSIFIIFITINFERKKSLKN